ERIFMENIGAVKELCKVTDNLETRIDQLERINRRLTKLKRGDSLKSNSTASSGTKHIHYQKCLKNHSCHNEIELCSTKFIQIIIIILVLIMAFCLAAITTLYLMEAANHNNYVQHTSMQSLDRTSTTKKPTKNPSFKPWNTPYPHRTSTQYKAPTINIPPEIDTSTLIRDHRDIIGRPPDCLVVDQDLENTNICQIYCCNPPSRNKPEHISIGVFNEKRQKSMPNRTKVEAILDIDKKSIGKPFNNNNIDKSKQERQKRESDDWINQSNDFGPSVPEDQIFTITIQGRNFNKTLTTKYLINNSNNNHLLNFTYHVPISKYMPDEYINLTFKSTQANIKDVEHCYNDYRQNVCSSNSMGYFDDPSVGMPHKVNENQPIQQIAQQSVTFEVNMIGVQWKIMTYRAALRQTQSVCKLSSTKLGLEYMEYNFRFFRLCDE
ncbi:myelin regulatory factor, partial [Agrilus planipennis]|uniref:Myelin regulatory factor n=1 Tax=Agrilus planipennis TaxID=224129 RepID=A0A1W4XR89_AGRPL